ncbi:hypothetical protein SCUCBS95973_007359 [Sporothrix curviconia]|uniref:37S ribosomal protein rsm22 n=1 Tax=Sporothrix curviconia TaxID=1260050 RepID=A0ABP0CCQ6_9PEZI
MSDWVIVCPLPASLHARDFAVGFLKESAAPVLPSLEQLARPLRDKTTDKTETDAPPKDTSAAGLLDTFDIDIPFPRKQLPLTPPKHRELAWLLTELGDDLRGLQTSLRNCYQLLRPDEGPSSSSNKGNTLVVSTPRTEAVKGHITRRGTRIARGTIHLKLRTLPSQTLSIDQDHPITIAPLDDLEVLLRRSIDLLDITLAHAYPDEPTDASTPPRVEAFLAAQLRVLAQALSDAASILHGPPLLSDTDPLWTSRSAALSHFRPPLAPAISFYLGLQESQLVLWLRALEPADQPVNLGMKFALALGTARRIEHDEAEQVFTYCCEDGCAKGLHTPAASDTADAKTAATTPPDEGPARVFVREKLRVESADPNLLSLSAKLNALSNSLLQTRRNLAAVMGEELEE